MLRAFFDANRRVSRRVEAWLPQATENVFDAYEATVADYMNTRPGQLVVDVGGGKACPFARWRRSHHGTRIIAVDISEDEIRHNRDVDEARVGDIMRDLPFAREEVDIVASRSVLEHLTDLEAFTETADRVLKPGGLFIHLFPGRFALFAMINRSLPNWLSRRILYFFHPKVAGINGFPAFYDRCYPSAMQRLLHARGFEIVRLDVSYYQSRYYDFFLPAYLVSAVYELVAYLLGARDLAAYVLVVARKRG